MTIGVVGLGYWGPNIVRNLVALGQRVFVYDRESARVQAVAGRFPVCIPACSLEAMLEDPEISALAIAVPLPSHSELVIRALRAHKHVFVEKPLCATVEEADAIGVHLNGQVLMVAHITQFSPGVRCLAGSIRQGAIGDVRRLMFARTHLGPVYPSTDVLTEIAAHDVAILVSLMNASPARVRAWGVDRMNRGTPDAAHVVFDWTTGEVAQIDVQWSSAVRRREVEIEGTRGTLLLRAQERPEELLLFDQEEAYDALRKGAQAGEAAKLVRCKTIPVPETEPLRDELAAFLGCVERGESAPTDYGFSRNVVGLLAAARRSMISRGETVHIQ